MRSAYIRSMPKESTAPMTNAYPVRLFPEQKRKLKEAARRMRLSEQDCFRKALDFGLPALERALTPDAKAA
jgi:hypothetical protein